MGQSGGDEVWQQAFDKPGSYQLSVLDESGQTAQVEFAIGL